VAAISPGVGRIADQGDGRVWKILSEDYAIVDKGFFAGALLIPNKIIQTAPGSGKSRRAPRFVIEPAAQRYKGFYMLLTKEAIKERPGYLECQEWDRWEPHAEGCVAH